MISTTTPSWQKLGNDNIFQRNSFAIASYQNRYIVVAGGCGRDRNELRSAFIFDSFTNEYKLLPDLPGDSTNNYGRFEICSGVVLNSYFYLVGRVRQLYRINISSCHMSKNWETIDCDILSGGLSYVASDGKSLFVFCAGSFSAFDPETHQWTALPRSFNRTCFSTAVVDGKIYFIGGSLGMLKATSSVNVYDIASRTWKQGPDLPMELCDSSASVLLGRWIVVTGGITIDRAPSNKCAVFDTHTRRWNNPKFEGSSMEVRLPTARMRHGFVIIGKSQGVYIGGNDRNGEMFHIETIRKKRFSTLNDEFCLQRMLDDKSLLSIAK